MSTVVRFPGGTHVAEAARQLVAKANDTGAHINAEFNGTPMLAGPGDTPELVVCRWEYERTVRQLKAGTLRIEDL